MVVKRLDSFPLRTIDASDHLLVQDAARLEVTLQAADPCSGADGICRKALEKDKRDSFTEVFEMSPLGLRVRQSFRFARRASHPSQLRFIPAAPGVPCLTCPDGENNGFTLWRAIGAQRAYSPLPFLPRPHDLTSSGSADLVPFCLQPERPLLAAPSTGL